MPLWNLNLNNMNMKTAILAGFTSMAGALCARRL